MRGEEHTADERHSYEHRWHHHDEEEPRHAHEHGWHDERHADEEPLYAHADDDHHHGHHGHHHAGPFVLALLCAGCVAMLAGAVVSAVQLKRAMMLSVRVQANARLQFR